MNNKHTIEKHLLFLYDEISENEKREILRHHDECRECKKDFARMVEIMGLVDSLPKEDPPVEIINKIISSAGRIKRKVKIFKTINIFLPAYKTVYRYAAVFTVLILIAIYVFNISRKDLVNSSGCFTGKLPFNELNVTSTINSEKAALIKNEYSYRVNSIPGRRNQSINAVHQTHDSFDDDLDKKMESLEKKINGLLADLKNQ